MKQQAKHRAQRIFEAVAHAYPNAWKLFDLLKKNQGKEPDFEWPDWCYMPIAGGFAIASEKRPLQLSKLAHPAIITALGTWRQTKGVYRFDDTLLKDLIKTDVEDLPKEVLLRLPEWCIYIELDNCNLHPDLKGVFVSLEYDVQRGGQEELRLLFDFAKDLKNPLSELIPMPLILTGSTIDESLNALYKSASLQIEANCFSSVDLEEIGTLSKSKNIDITYFIQPILSLVLYICHTTDVVDRSGELIWRSRVSVKSTKNITIPSDPRVWDVGIRMGQALKKAYLQYQTQGESSETHKSMRPHVRRAHWHKFRAGPMKNEDGNAIPTESRELKVKWLPPIPVNIDEDTDLPTTVHKVN